MKPVLFLLLATAVFAQQPAQVEGVTLEWLGGDSVEISWFPVAVDTAGDSICISWYAIYNNHSENPVFVLDNYCCSRILYSEYDSEFYWITAKEGG